MHRERGELAKLDAAIAGGDVGREEIEQIYGDRFDEGKVFEIEGVAGDSFVDSGHDIYCYLRRAALGEVNRIAIVVKDGESAGGAALAEIGAFGMGAEIFSP